MDFSALFKSKYFGIALIILVLGVIFIVAYPIFGFTNVVTKPFTIAENTAQTVINDTEQAGKTLGNAISIWWNTHFGSNQASTGAGP